VGWGLVFPPKNDRTEKGGGKRHGEGKGGGRAEIVEDEEKGVNSLLKEKMRDERKNVHKKKCLLFDWKEECGERVFGGRKKGERAERTDKARTRREGEKEAHSSFGERGRGKEL